VFEQVFGIMGDVTEFLQVSSRGGILLLPREVVDTTLPSPGDPFREMELLGLAPERIAALDDTDTLDLLAAIRKRKARAEAMEQRALARLNELRKGDRYVGDEAALELRISRNAGANRVTTATALVHRLPGVLAAMDDGELDGYTASRLVDACQGLSDDKAREVDELLAAKRAAGTLNLTDPTSLRRVARRLAVRVDPDAVATRARKARCERRVQVIHGEDTMSTLLADLPAEIASAAYANVDKHARRLRDNGDERNLDQLRADILGDLLCGHPADGSGTKPAAMVFLHMPITTALTMTDHGCELAGYGPIPGPIAREIMTNPKSVLRKVLVDPGTGKIEGLGRTRRRPNQALRDLIAARDRECPFCHRPAQACDLDHLNEWAKDGGGTDPENLGPKCEREHYLKDHPHWDLDFDPDSGEATLTTPAKRTFTRQRESIIEPEPPPKPKPPPEPAPPRKILLPDEPPF
jgi:hypothetical protein